MFFFYKRLKLCSIFLFILTLTKYGVFRLDPYSFSKKKYDVFHKQEKISMVTHNVGVILILYYSLHQMWLKSTTRKDIVAKKMLLLCTPE
jgi:hypothetical protein